MNKKHNKKLIKKLKDRRSEINRIEWLINRFETKYGCERFTLDEIIERYKPKDTEYFNLDGTKWIPTIDMSIRKWHKGLANE